MKTKLYSHPPHEPAEVLFITSFPPRVCGIASYSQDLIKALNNKFSTSFDIKVCALETEDSQYIYGPEVKYTLNTTKSNEFKKLAERINRDEKLKLVVLQHEFGLFKHQQDAFLLFIKDVTKPLITVFHTIIVHPPEELKSQVKLIFNASQSIVVMTHISAEVLIKEYGAEKEKISVIAHGTHLVSLQNKHHLKAKYRLTDRKVLTTFGLLGPGKSIETTIEALPEIVKHQPEVVFLILGKTHPEIVKSEGEQYRNKLEELVKFHKLGRHVRFINEYLGLPELLEYLQLTDIYLFTSKDPNQAVSGTFVYAMSCGCPIVSTPIPHAKELLGSEKGLLFDFNDSVNLSSIVVRLLNDDSLRRKIKVRTLEKIVSTVWENAAVAHGLLFEKIGGEDMQVRYNLPDINLHHLKQMTTSFGLIQFAVINQPDTCSGYTLDDNARALVATGMYYKKTGDQGSLHYIDKYLKFIKYCLQPEGNFLNYVDIDNNFTTQNKSTSLEDSNGRAIWALGFTVSLAGLLPFELINLAKSIFQKAFRTLKNSNSPRAMAFSIKGLYFYNLTIKHPDNILIINTLTSRLVALYKNVSNPEWLWFETSLTYANSILPEALLYAWLLTVEKEYREIALNSFNFLLTKTFSDEWIKVISNKQWLQKGEIRNESGGGEQPIDIAYTIMTLSKFYDEFGGEEYLNKMMMAFNWFLGNNRLHQIVYNPGTGGCYDGLEETHVNLNQGAESTVSYLMARLTIEKYMLQKPRLRKSGRLYVKPIKKLTSAYLKLL